MASTSDNSRQLDVREIDGEPFDDIVRELDDLPRGEQLVLLSGFEPVPLYDVLSRRGFTCETTRVSDDEYRVVIEHG
jgi:uncharacterized protein (DUF2249 family)